jgi:hypothetical protein
VSDKAKHDDLVDNEHYSDFGQRPAKEWAHREKEAKEANKKLDDLFTEHKKKINEP